MKAYLNKRAKVKYETVPAAPEITADYIADMIGESDDITDAIVDTVKENVELDDLKNIDTSRIVEGWFLSKDEDTGEWFTGLPSLFNLSDSTYDTATVENGDTLVYDSVLRKFTTVHAETWGRIDTITADGTSDKIRTSITGVYSGFFIVANTKTGAADANFGIVFEFNTNPVTRKAVGDVPAGISGSGQSYMNAFYGRDANLWNGYITDRASAVSAAPAKRERLDSYFLAPDLDTAVSVIEIRTTSSGAVIPENSTFTIYGKKR